MVVLQLQDASSIDSHDSNRAKPRTLQRVQSTAESHTILAHADRRRHPSCMQQGSRRKTHLVFLLIAAIKPRILERDCGLRRKHLQYRDTVRSENVWRQIVFKVENADEFGLVGSVANRQTGGRWC